MKKYEPQSLVKISRYQNYFPALPDYMKQDMFKNSVTVFTQHKRVFLVLAVKEFLYVVRQGVISSYRIPAL